MEQKIYTKVVNDKEYEINPKKYYETFKEKHVEKIECQICGGHYNYFSKYLHFKSKKHNNCILILQNYEKKL